MAGKGKGLELIHSLEPLIRQKTEYHIEVTTAKGEATNIVRRYTTEENYIVFAVGGDGTVNEVLNGLMGSESSLAIIPTGSGNDFVRSIYCEYTLTDLIPELLDGITEKIDVIKVGEQYSLNITSVGLDAEVVYNASYYKQKKFIKGEMAYLISLIKTLLNPKGTYARVIMDGKEICNEKILLLAIGNGAYYGGGIHMIPQAVVNDALSDVCLIRTISFRKILIALPKLFKARHGEVEEVEMYQAKTIEIETPSGCKINVDGEVSTITQTKIITLPQC